MNETIGKIEEKRVALQAGLDGQKTQAERNRLGQFATPPGLAEDLLAFAKENLDSAEKIRFLDPAIGTGAFYSALRRVLPERRIVEAVGFEIDPHYGRPASDLWKDSNLTVRIADFTHASPHQHYNLIICNPPYVRHHHLENREKTSLQLKTFRASGMKLSGLAGLYCHFLGLSHPWMEKGAIAGWLIPSEFMDVNYGDAVKRYLLNCVTLLRIHRFDPNDVQFADALVSSAVAWFRNVPPPQHHTVRFTFGGTLLEPRISRDVPVAALAEERKWTRFPSAGIRVRAAVPTLTDFFQIKRGIATGDNRYFILEEREIAARKLPFEAFTPILPSPRYLSENEITADHHGNPQVEPRLFLLNTKLSEAEIERRFPRLHAYLEEGKARGLPQRYLCQHRSPWYAQEDRPPAPIVCTYLGRANGKRRSPFRFILNRSHATVANVYLAMYPRPNLAHAMRRDTGLLLQIWKILNCLTPEQVLGEGRVYGGGLHKLEPKELANVAAPEITQLLDRREWPSKQTELFAHRPVL